MSSSKGRLSIRFLLCLVRPEDFSLAGNRLVRVLKVPEENADTSSPSFSLGRSSLPWAPSTLSESLIARPEGADRAHGAWHAKGCGREYQPRRWNQRYCQEPEYRRQVRQWQAAGGRPNTAGCRGQSPPRPSRAHRQRVKNASQASRNQRLRRRVVTQQKFFSAPLAIGRVLSRPVTSLRNPPVVLCPACRHAAAKSKSGTPRPSAARWTVARSGPTSTKPLAGAGLRGGVTPPLRRRRGLLRSDDSSGVRRSSIIALPSWGLVS